MRNIVLALVIILMGAYESIAENTLFDKIDIFLNTHLKRGMVDFESIYKNPIELNEIISKIANYDLSEASPQEQVAFYINAYNLLVIHAVIKFYPIQSPMDIKGFFTDYQYQVAGEKLTLDQIEFKKLFGRFPDVRYHFVLNCAAISCPTLYAEAIRPEKLEDQLMYSLLTVIDRDDYVQIDHKKKTVQLSKIFDWYRADFEKEATSVVTYIRNYRFDRIPPGYSIEYMEYDWTLNNTSNALENQEIKK